MKKLLLIVVFTFFITTMWAGNTFISGGLISEGLSLDAKNNIESQGITIHSNSVHAEAEKGKMSYKLEAGYLFDTGINWCNVMIAGSYVKNGELQYKESLITNSLNLPDFLNLSIGTKVNLSDKKDFQPYLVLKGIVTGVVPGQGLTIVTDEIKTETKKTRPGLGFGTAFGITFNNVFLELGIEQNRISGEFILIDDVDKIGANTYSLKNISEISYLTQFTYFSVGYIF